MIISPYAGKPAQSWMLVDIPKLISAYYSEIPDPFIEEQKVSSELQGTAAHHSKDLLMNGISLPLPRLFVYSENNKKLMVHYLSV
jgi:hypothetical protein